MRTPLPILLLVMASAARVGAQQPKGGLGVEAARRGGGVIPCRYGSTESADEDEMTLRLMGRWSADQECNTIFTKAQPRSPTRYAQICGGIYGNVEISQSLGRVR